MIVRARALDPFAMVFREVLERHRSAEHRRFGDDCLRNLALIERIRAVRLPREPLPPALRYDRRHLLRKCFEATVFNLLSRWALPRLQRAGMRYPDRMFGLHQTGHISEEYVLAVLAALPPGINELYCHPAIIDDEARRWRPADYESEQEFAALTSPRVRAAIERTGIELISYRELVG